MTARTRPRPRTKPVNGDISQAIDILLQTGDLRVWSVIATIFGDLARDPGDTIDGPTLSALTGRLKIRPEAMRVALFRLRRDGWIESQRAGRTSRYSLSETGYRETTAARSRIYRWRNDDADCRILIAGPSSLADRCETDAGLRAAGYRALQNGVYVGPDQPDAAPPGWFSSSVQSAGVPDWLRQHLAPEQLGTAYAELAAALARLDLVPGPGRVASLLDIAALRVLIVHDWRRLLLRTADVPDGFFPPGWSGHDCRARVADLLTRLTRPSLKDLGER